MENEARIDFIKHRLKSAFTRIQEAKFEKGFQTEENIEKFTEFLDTDENNFLLFGESLRCEVQMPTKIGRGKWMLFIKLARGSVSIEHIAHQVLFLELSGPSPFEQLELLANEVFLPLLSNNNNQSQWGEVPTRELLDRFHVFLSSSTILCGHVKGETRLPMPPIDFHHGSSGKNRISLLEGAIITWTKQIRNVLKQDPEMQLKAGLHPTPDVEVNFWKNKAANLNSIFEQLQGSRIRRVLRALDQSKSTYCATFARLCKEVLVARIEANDNMKYLRTLEDWFDRLNSESDYPQLADLFKPMLHIILLIWKNSKHYNTPTRLVVLIREICNSLINQSNVYVSGREIFRLIDDGDASIAVKQLKTTLQVCGHFKMTYFDYRRTANAECPANPWRIQNNALFMRLDSFLERCHDILDLAQTIVQFTKLEKIEVGGTKGKTLTNSIKQIYRDFLDAVDTFKSVNYDIMDVSAKGFNEDYHHFRMEMKELERRLGSVISLAFDDCSTVNGKFRLLDSFDGLLDRPIIQDELEKKYIDLIDAYEVDLRTVQDIFLTLRDHPNIPRNFPPITGSLTWCRGLVQRIHIPMGKLQQLDKSVLEREEAKEVSKIYTTIITSLQEYENQKIEEWGRDVEVSSHAKLKLPLLTRDDENQFLMVNFDPALIRLLREVKYFLLLGIVVPESALEIYEKVEIFRRWTCHLDMITQKNNDVLDQLLPVESPLLEPYMRRFNKVIEPGLYDLNWLQDGIDDFLHATVDAINEVDEIVRTMKTNLKGVHQTTEEWSQSLMVRKAKPVPKDEFETEHKAYVRERYQEIKETGKSIHSLLKQTNKVLKVSNASHDWVSYVDFINNVVIQGLSKTITSSLDYLIDQIDLDLIKKERKNALIQISLNLIEQEVVFQPSISYDHGKGLKDLMDSWIGSFFHVSTLFKRLDNDGSYMREMHNDGDVMIRLAMIHDLLAQTDDECESLKSSYEEYNHLWTLDMKETFDTFLEEALIETEHGQKIPDLAKFDQEMVKYEEVLETIRKLPNPVQVGWLKIDTLPIKQKMMNWVLQWKQCFVSHLKTTLFDHLSTLNTFMKKVLHGLDLDVVEQMEQVSPSSSSDAIKQAKDGLMAVMGDIRDVRKSMDTTVELFEPFTDIIRLLKGHGIDMNDLRIESMDIQDYIEEVPMAWDNVVKKTFLKKEEILPLQQAEVDSLKEELEAFYISIRDFRNGFKDQAPFQFEGTSSEAYHLLDTFQRDLIVKEKEVRKYNELEELFELPVSKYPAIGNTRNELQLLKGVWDIKSYVDKTYADWTAQLWSAIDTDSLEDANKKMKKQIRLFSTEHAIVKGWQIYRDIEESMKNMELVLPLINSLHSNCMRDRHWDTLATVCNVHHVDPVDPKFTFDDMLQLNLHVHIEDVEEIVETAMKEMKIENKLRIIESVWKDLIMEYTPHRDSDIMLIKPSEEVIEALEGHQLELQTMIGMGKFVDYFKDRVLGWQNTLGHVEDVIKVWMNVSRSWASLESIFLVSADIRSQLPDDTKRFEGIDSEFKELMKDACEVTSVIQVCHVDGRLELLQSMMGRLEECQKSLNEYLDQKKKIFPRFYFVSNVALLDMLANGTNPPRIVRYLSDCYDALANVLFVKNEDTGEVSNKVVHRMIAKDREQLDFHEPFTMEGEVENYLNELTLAMQTTLKHSLDAGVESAANWELEKPRHLWLFDFPAQVVVTGTQIYFTEEAEAALEEFESGQEDAVKKYLATCHQRLYELIQLVLTDLKKGDRTKIITLITLDVHGRDVIQKLIDDKTEGPSAFLWQQQLRFYWSQPTLDVDVKILDFATKYFYEWIGNTGRLVITPLTDRCYVTLTMGLRLFLGGAPAGPAGTGKTETTKDLGRALSLPVYVFNCSDQMNYKTMADIFKGLTQVGAWGCFDEFNRIQIEVLSVIATQVKTIQDYIKRYANPMNRETEYQRLPAGLPPVKVGEFLFEGDVISLIPSCGFFITMNPGYAGRTELPENLKALFRSCAMIRPDLEPICENMLMSEGFQTAKTLAVKFVTLYGLSSELLSKQFHYDWGLRAVKSVLRVAGMLKRGEPELDEAQILMRALRDFNLPKIPNIDEPIFRRLISDLFMGIDVSVKLDESLRDKVTSVANQRKLQDDAGFVLKVLQFQELLDVRHSVMILGPAGCGKTTIWKTLSDAHNWEHDKQAFKSKKTCVYETVNPKAVTGNELYGYMTLAKDWKDGVISIIMRGMSKNFSEQGFHDYQTYKWVVLDGDIDAEWIESMNTVMDDNKVLTLVSNERVPLSDAMRMIFEISSLKNATPATVSRAGILYVNETDIGWKPFVDSWIEKREEARKEDASLYPDPLEGERTYLPVFFDKYIEAASDMIRKDFKEVTPIRLINRVTTIVHLLEAILNDLPGEKKTMEILENIFVYCLVWAFGGPMIQDKLVDYRQRFNDMFAVTFGSQFPKEKTCFDYYFDVDAQAFVDWSERVPEYTPLNIGSKPDETQFSDVYVSTTDSVRMTYLIDLLAKNGKFAMLVGGAGTGKTAIIQQYLSSLDKDADGLLSSYITMSYFTDSAKLQGELELPIDKRSGRRFGPPASKRLIFFLDDLNLPYVETYGTQNAIALLTQHMQYGTIFDRLDLGFRKEIVDVQYLAAMNPTAGSFEICERCQRHFSTFACLMPSDGDLSIIFQSVLQGHLLGYPDSMVQEIETIVSASVQLHTKVSKKFLPSAVKFTYNWNMRELAGIFEGLTKTTMQYYDSPIGLKRLWMHEAYRVFTDRMFSLPEIEDFEVLLKDVIKSTLNISNMDEFMGTKPLFTNFATTNDGAYLDIPDFPTLKSVIETKLNEYNESNAMMDLVLFEDAIEHVTRISRILSSPGGNAMLIGVGGSGKQSLSRLASFISGFEVRQLPITSSYKMEDLQEALQELFKQAGVKGQSIVWLLTDSQIVNEKFLVYINSILATGWISDLFAKEDLDGMLGAIRNEAKAANVPDHPDALLEFFIRRLKVNFHIILCFSPVGETFRVRARRFPGLINCTTIDFFHPWPKEALISVAHRFIDEVELEDGELKEKLAMHMAEEHLSVTTASIRLYETQRRYNYTTPKSFLELISFYKYLLEKKRNDFMKLIDRLDVGLSTLRKTAADVSELQEDLKHTMEKVEEKKVMTDALIEEMGVQRQDAEVQQEAANIEAEKASKAAYEASLIEQEAEQELSEAEPAMREAAKAVDVLSKSMLTELKSLPNPPSGVDKVTNACLILVEHEFRQLTWDRAKKMMANVDQFKNRLRDIRGEDITDDIIERLRPYMEDAEFDPSFMLSKSAAAANLCSWCVNIYRYNRIYVKVKPLMDRLHEAQDSKATAEASLKAAQDNVAEVQAKLEALQQSFMEATEEKAKVEAEAERCLNRLALAERLVNGLSSENERWGNEIEKLRESAHTLVGDCMLASGFVSYIGAFDQQFRRTLWQETWLPDLIERGIPTTEGVNVLTMLTNDGHTAKMIADGLPSDSISVENGAIISNCKRWPLIIDPQQQGIKWLRRKGEREGQLEVIQLNQKNWQRTLVNAMTNGTTIIIENLGEEITATMEPVLSRAFYKKGRSLFLQFGGEEVEYDPKFQLYLQTKYSNPHYKPEIAAQCTLINFIATEKGLEDQLLAKVVGVERPELEREMQELQAAFQQYKIQLVELEDDILERLANAPDDILSDVPLIESLEATKKAANEITKAVEQGKITEIEINKARESFRPQATEGAMLYFLLTKLSAIDHMYQYSLDSFVSFFFKSIEKAKQPSESSNDPTTERVLLLRESLRMTIYTWISRGLFERHKLTFLAQITFNLMKRGILGDDNIPDEVEFQFLLRGTKKTGEANVLSWLPDSAWDACQALSELEEFGKFSSDLVEASSRFQEWFNLLAPEDEKLPLDWSGLDRTPFKKMLVVRCLRPDRMTNSLSTFIRTVLPNGHDYVECDASMSSVDIIDQSLNDSGPETPIYFILSPGSNVLGDLDVLAGKYGYVSGQSYHNISMGQGQDIIAMRTLENAHRNGHWVILNNIHLMPSWLEELEKKLDEFALEGSHERFKLYLSSEPANSIPIGILNRSIKLTNEPPTGLKANLKRAFASFSKEQFDEYDSKTKSILFGLCHFHSIMLERKMYGPLGYNMMYPFGVGDLRDSSVVLNNYMEQSGGGKIPWQDLRYIFGEIMYGGHIVNDFDRLMANTYLEWFMRDELLDEMELYPFAEDEKGVSFMTPLPTSYDRYLEYIDQAMGSDTPIAFGLHPNAEIEFRTTMSDNTFRTLMELQPRDASSGEGTMSPEQIAETALQDILERFGDKKFDVEELMRSLDDQGPYQNVFLQEMDIMNVLLDEIIRSLNELQLGFSGELTMSEAMETLKIALFMDQVPETWAKKAWPSRRGLSSWLSNFGFRLEQLDQWQNNPLDIPRTTWISGFVNPQSFLTAICQVTAKSKSWELDKLVTETEVTKEMDPGNMSNHSKDGAYIFGVAMQGARWDLQSGFVDKSRPKEMFCPMPVINVKAVASDKADRKGIYECPVYKTEQRGPTFVFLAQLKTKSPSQRWVLAGVALIMDIV